MSLKKALKKKSKVSDHSIEIDVSKLFGGKRGISDDIKEDVAYAVIDAIVERTRSGKSVKGNSFKKLSKAYAGIKGTSKVNLTLDGDMLDELDIVSIKGNKVKIGWDDTVQSNKAFNHDTGDTLPKREFFGATEAELKAIVKEFKDEVDA